MDAEQIRMLLATAGFHLAPQDAQAEAREDRWAVLLTGQRMAWFPMNADGLQRLATERRVLRLLQARCSFRVPRVLFVAAAGWEVRALVSGVCDPWGLFQQVRNDRALARRIGRSLGGILAEQHLRVCPEDAAGWLPKQLSWPKPREWIEARLPHVVQDARLRRGIDRVLRRCHETEDAGPGGRVLVHGDLGLHNIAVDPQTAEVQGVFDYDGAAWADRHHDFRYLVFDRKGDDMLEAALEVYEPTVAFNLTGGASGVSTPLARSAFWRSAAARRLRPVHAGGHWLRIWTGCAMPCKGSARLAHDSRDTSLAEGAGLHDPAANADRTVLDAAPSQGRGRGGPARTRPIARDCPHVWQ